MKPKLLIALTFASATLPAAALAEGTNGWRFDTSLNLFLAGLSGDVTAKGVPSHVDASFKDIFEHLEAGIAGRFTVARERWSLSTEFSYMRLSASTSAATLDLAQWLIEPSVGYQLCRNAQLFAGARCNSLSGDVTVAGPLGNTHRTTGTQEWCDPIVGAQLSFPLAENRLSLDGRFDVGGFGAASDFTWQAFPHLNWRFSRWGSAQFGYRWLGTDYESGNGANKFKYDVVAQGPQIGFTFHF